MSKARIPAAAVAVLVLLCVSAYPRAAAADVLKYYSVDVDNTLNGRAKPSTSADISTKLRNGDCVVSNGKATRADGYSWVQIMHPRDVSSSVWVADKFIKPSPFCEQAFDKAQDIYVAYADTWTPFFMEFCDTRDYAMRFDSPAAASELLHAMAADTMNTQYKFYCYDTGKEREDPEEKAMGGEVMATAIETMASAAEQTIYEELCKLPPEDAFFQVYTPEANAADGALTFSYFGGADCGQTLHINKTTAGAWQATRLVFHCAVCW